MESEASFWGLRKEVAGGFATGLSLEAGSGRVGGVAERNLRLRGEMRPRNAG